MKRRFVNLCMGLLVAAMILIPSANPALAERGALADKASTPAKYFEYEVEDGQAIITRFIGPSKLTKVVVPSKLGGYPVTGINNYVFEWRYKLKTVVLPNGLQRIGDGAFQWCEGLTSINFPDSLQAIGCSAFSSCKRLRKITLPSQVSVIEEDTFYECRKLTQLKIKGQITEIGDRAFAFGGFTKVTIGPLVRSIGVGAFSNCKNLKSIDVVASNPAYSSIDGVLFDKNQSVLLLYPSAKRGASYNVPSSVREIAYFSFRGNRYLETVKMTNSVVEIGASAFCESKELKSITLSSSLKKLEYWVLYSCRKLKTVEVPEGVEELGSNAVNTGAKTTQIYLPRSLKRCGSGAISQFGTTLYVYEGSFAHQFAISKGHNYVLR